MPPTYSDDTILSYHILIMQISQTSPLFYERGDDRVSLLDKPGLDTSDMAFELDDDGIVFRMTHGVCERLSSCERKRPITTNLIIIVMSVLIIYFLFACFRD